MRDPRGYWQAFLRQVGCSQRVIDHCNAVCDLALDYYRPGIMERSLLEAGATLHDIGRSRTHGLAHAQVGARLCRDAGVSEEIARIVECHLGAGLTADECTLLCLLPIDCIPRTAEEKVVANADNLVSGTRVIGIEERMMRAISLPRRIRIRLFHLWLEMEIFRRYVPGPDNKPPHDPGP
ncbi:MAG: HDIG domain-containing protein [Methanolinea sp.]|nr:HDIG domain-containing protein [Methanolinea sp.]